MSASSIFNRGGSWCFARVGVRKENGERYAGAESGSSGYGLLVTT